MDRGMTSADNLEWLRETARWYLVGTPKSELRKWARAIADVRDWQTVRDGVEAKQCVVPDGVETFVLIRSVERREKERAMQERFARRIEERLTRLGRRVQQARRPLDVRRLNGRSAASRSRTSERPRATSSNSSPIRRARLECAWTGASSRNGTTGRAGARAVTCCART